MKRGLYEEIITKKIEDEIKSSKLEVGIDPLDDEASPKLLAKYIYTIMEKTLKGISNDSDDDTLNKQIELVNNIGSMIDKDYYSDGENITKAEILKYVVDKSLSSITGKNVVIKPLTSITNSTLFTGAPKEPVFYSEIQKEILTSDRVDILISFIRLSGLNLIYSQLEEFTNNGGKLRILTTTYMGATEAKAINKLSKLKNTEIKISYDSNMTRLHAKSYLFHRDNGYTTAYIGSSNISKAAMTNGMEWNMKVTNKDLSDVVSNMIAQYNVYWSSPDFESYTDDNYSKLCDALRKDIKKDEMAEYLFTIKPYRYQQEVLDKINAEREVKGNFKNLLVCPTGVGKTAISAFDYYNFRKNNISSKLLFIAHRKEILEQSISCYRKVLQDYNFGELMVDNYEPKELNYLFCSIDKFNSRKMIDILQEDYYDYIVIDEVHHLAADSYQSVIEHFKPKVLLGLTATPDRLDGRDIYKYFNYKITAEISMSEAIDRGMLAPFHYFGVTDTVDLSDLKWVNSGYDTGQLNEKFVHNKESANERAANILLALDKYAGDINEVKALGFCSSVEHATFMANYFNERGVPSEALSGNTPRDIRNIAKNKLISGELKVIFVRDIYNEGVDIKAVNTVMFLRPTESKTIFTQQLGRGLRVFEGKECLTVLDFVGQAHKKFSYANKFEALCNFETISDMKREIITGFNRLPRGCYINLEKKAQEYILENIKRNSSVKSIIISNVEEEYSKNNNLNLYDFYTKYSIEPGLIYGKIRTTFSSLVEYVKGNELDHSKQALIIYRLSSIDSPSFLQFFISNINKLESISYDSLSDKDKSNIRILYDAIYEDVLSDDYIDYVDAIVRYLKDNEFMVLELYNLFLYMFDRIDVVTKHQDLNFDNSLEVYGTYTKRQFMAVLDQITKADISEGVKYIKELNTDIFFVTLNKNHTYYGATTSYRDYPVNDVKFVVESQSKISDHTETGKRYIDTKNNNERSILLLVREVKNGKNGAEPFTYLGRARYVSHTGNKPMSITLELEDKIPARILKATDRFGLI